MILATLISACQSSSSAVKPTLQKIEPVESTLSINNEPVVLVENNSPEPQTYLSMIKKSMDRFTDKDSSLNFNVQAMPLVNSASMPRVSGQPSSLPPRLPDSEVVYGPSALDFDIEAYLNQAGGSLAKYQEYLASSGWTSAADIVRRVSLANSVNPRLLLALLDYQCDCVRGSNEKSLDSGYALGAEDYHRKGLYGQLWWAANQLSAGFYGHQEGWLKQFVLPNGETFLIDPHENPGQAALQVYFSRLWSIQDQSAKMGSKTWVKGHPHAFGETQWRQALDPQQGFLDYYSKMFPDYSQRASLVEPLVPDNLQQPLLILPFEKEVLWSFISGPHQAWENEGSLAALDFAPASDHSGCWPSKAWITAVADGPVVRVAPGLVMQDLDALTPSDGKEETGWAVLYMHVESQDKSAVGTHLKAGDRIGHPSCEGGPSNGTHLHIARKYNGVWIAAAGPVPFVMDGWLPEIGQKLYQGKLVKDDQVIIAHPYASFETHISRPETNLARKPGCPVKTNLYDR